MTWLWPKGKSWKGSNSDRGPEHDSLTAPGACDSISGRQQGRRCRRMHRCLLELNMNGQLVFCQKFSFPFCSPKYVMDLWSKLTPSKNGCPFYLNSLLEPELLSFLQKHVPIVAAMPTFPGTFQRQSYYSALIVLLPRLTGYPPPRPRPGRQGRDTRPTLATVRTGQVRVAGTVVSECTGVGGGWREPPSGKGVKRMTLAARAGERRAVEIVSAGYFQAGSIWVASCPLISGIGKAWWLSCSGNCAPHHVRVGTGPLSAHGRRRNRPSLKAESLSSMRSRLPRTGLLQSDPVKACWARAWFSTGEPQTGTRSRPTQTPVQSRAVNRLAWPDRFLPCLGCRETGTGVICIYIILGARLWWPLP